MESLVTYLVAAMMTWVPLNAQPRSESPETSQAHYESIARDLASVVWDESEQPLFDGPDARAETALLMLSIASFESSYQVKVDDGNHRGDNGHSYCLMQIHVGDGKTREGWTGGDLVANRTMCFRAALHILHASFNACRAFPLEDRLGAYATGHCFQGANISRSRVSRARNYWLAHAPPRLPPSEG
jgi:hypothetical protein